MNYESHYDRLMSRAKQRGDISLFERHHVIPKCLGGSNDASNIVKLTPEEHYTAHLLLVKMHPHHKGLAWAAIRMCQDKYGHRTNNKLYGWLRKEHAKAVSTRMMGNTINTGRKQTVEEKSKRSVSAKRFYAETGRSKEHCENLAAVNRKNGKARKRKCTIDGQTFFDGVRDLIKTLGQGKHGSRSPSFRYVEEVTN